jgi:hypothetical protein
VKRYGNYPKHWYTLILKRGENARLTGGTVMAKQIKDTPVLTGKNARHFEAWMKENQSKKICPQAYARIKDAAKKFKLA